MLYLVPGVPGTPLVMEGLQGYGAWQQKPLNFSFIMCKANEYVYVNVYVYKYKSINIYI